MVCSIGSRRGLGVGSLVVVVDFGLIVLNSVVFAFL